MAKQDMDRRLSYAAEGSQTGGADAAASSMPQNPPDNEQSGGETLPSLRRDASNLNEPRTPALNRTGPAGGSRPGRWWFAVLGGCGVSFPFGWLLSYAAALPFFLGLFFFLIFGLMIGAMVHRMAARRRPYGLVPLLAGTTVVVLFCSGVSIIKEGRDFPSDTAARLVNRTRTLGGMTVEEFRETVEEDVLTYLRQQYPPGGAVGYMRFVLTGARNEEARLAGEIRRLDVPQRGGVWIVRVVLSVGLLAFGIGSQTLYLRKLRDPVVRAIDANAP